MPQPYYYATPSDMGMMMPTMEYPVQNVFQGQEVMKKEENEKFVIE